MYLIAHRGNTNGIIKEMENSPKYIEDAMSKGFHVEVDVRYENKQFFLGHDLNQFEIDEHFLLNEKIWCHAKTPEALIALHKINAHYFWHQEDDYTLTSKGFFWTYPGKKLMRNSICVLPEKSNYKKIDCRGICSDYIEKYK